MDGKNNIYIGTYYISPAKNKDRNKKNYDFFAAVNEEVEHFSKGLVLVERDFNCNVGTELDCVGHDKSDLELGLDNFDNVQ